MTSTNKRSLINKEMDAMLFGIRRSVRYHERRKRFYELWSTTTTTLALLFGSATFFSMINDRKELQTLAAALVTLTASLDLVIGFSRKACLHEELKKRFISLEMKAAAGATINDLQMERLAIEAEEPPVMKALNVICHNELMIADGFDSSSPGYFPLPWYKEQTANLFSWEIKREAVTKP